MAARFMSSARTMVGLAGITGCSFVAGSLTRDKYLNKKEVSSLDKEPTLLEATKEKLSSGFQLAAKEDPTRERTFIMIKPDGVQRGLVGDIVKRFEQKGFKLVAIRMMRPGESHLREHYADLSARPFFNGLVKYMDSGPVVAMCWEGQGVIKTGRVMLGETNPKDSKPGTIRGDYCIQVGRNIIHGSDSLEAATHEIKLWFSDKDVCDWEPAGRTWVYGDN